MARKRRNQILAEAVAEQVFINLQVILMSQNPSHFATLGYEDDLAELVEIVLTHEEKKAARK